MKPLFLFLFVPMISIAQGNFTNPGKTSSPQEIDLRSYYAYNKMVGQKRIYCYRQEGTQKHMYWVYSIVNDNLLIGEKYDELCRKNGVFKRVLFADHIANSGMEYYFYGNDGTDTISMSSEGTCPYKVNLKDNNFTISVYAKRSGIKLQEEYRYSRLTDTVGTGNYPATDYIKCATFIRNTRKGPSEDDGQKANDGDFQIFAKGIGPIYFTNGEEKYRLEKIVDGAEFARMKEEMYSERQ
jgi:hypothetical protein